MTVITMRTLRGTLSMWQRIRQRSVIDIVFIGRFMHSLFRGGE